MSPFSPLARLSRLSSFRAIFAVALLVASLGAARMVLAQDHHDMAMPAPTPTPATTVAKLGTVHFPISCTAESQQQFEAGVALLHSFEYESAKLAFDKVVQAEPRCAMAYWGQAMSLYRQLWGRPGASDLKQGHDLLKHAKSLKPQTERERQYIATSLEFFHDAKEKTYDKRLADYTTALKQLAAAHPDDIEASVFYSLALLASAPPHDPELKNEHEAANILLKLFDKYPNHPGIAHYIIHSCDHPSMAAMALPAAREYAAIAPASAHAVHMPSHIFARVGLWPDSIKSNEAALKVADQMASMKLHVLHHELHSRDYLHYAYLQIGDDKAAMAEYKALVAITPADAGGNLPRLQEHIQQFAARYAIEHRDWKTAAALVPIAEAKPQNKMSTYWGQAVGAGHLHDVATANAALKNYEAAMDEMRKGKDAYLVEYLADEHEQVQAWAAYATGNHEEGLKLMRSAADRQDKVGKGEADLPARESLASMLMEQNRPQEALTEYEAALQTDPNRFAGLYGAAQAAMKLGQHTKSSEYMAQLLKNCGESNSTRPELAEAKTVVASR